MINKKLTFKLLLLTTIFAFMFTSVGTVAAQINITDKLEGVGTAAQFSETRTLPQTIGQIVRALLSLLGIIFMGYVIYAGQLWMTARGNEEQITKAKAIIRGSIIGLLIVMLAYAITAFVVSRVVESTGYTATDTSSNNSSGSSSNTNFNFNSNTNSN